MKYVKLPAYGIFIRKSSILNRNIDRSLMLKVMESEAPYDETDDLVSFGPHFGGEALTVFIQRLEKLGLVYGTDFYDYQDIGLEWFQLGVSLQTE